ncbi:MAG: cytochrome c oxidase subunit II, partial [Anaerolineae bacterium]
MRRQKHLITAGILVLVVAVGLYFFLINIYQLPAAASAEAGPIDTMFQAHFAIIAFLFSLIMVFVLYAAVVFRRQPGDDTDGPHIHGHTGLEVAWTVIPVIMVIGFGAWGVVTMRDLVKAEPEEMVIRVYGQQWSWSFEYPEYDNLVSAELVLPVDQPILFEMESRDVLHSFWVPEFRVKQDLLPGRKTNLRITPTETGHYRLLCAEICGNAHSTMLAEVQVMSAASFDAWVEERMAGPAFAQMTPEERGEYWYSNEGFGCAGCHTLDGSRLVGPSWLGLVGRTEQLEDGSSVTADEAYILNSILHPADQIVAGYPNAMPAIYEQQFA